MELFTFKGPDDNIIEMTAPSKSQAVKRVKAMLPGTQFRLVSREPTKVPVRLPSFTKGSGVRPHTPSVTPPATAGLKRGDPCPCGSGKKYKYCCGRRRTR